MPGSPRAAGGEAHRRPPAIGRAARVRRSNGPRFVAVLLALAVAGGVGGVFLLGKTVTLVVDDRTRPVDTFAGTVGDLLREEGVPVDEHDEVRPGLSAPLADGMQVEVLLAKQITLSLNGTQRTVYVTGETVDDVLEQINVRAGRTAHVTPSRGSTVEDGDLIVYREAVNVRVAAGGQLREVITNEETVGDLLENLGIVYDGGDEITPAPRTPLSAGMLIRVVRVEISRVVQEEEIPFSTEVEKSSEYLQGVRKVIRAGVPGLIRRTFEVRLENGNEVERRLLETERVRAPVRQLVVEGTRPPRSDSGIASWYHRVGMVAAHPSLPMGTEVRVTNVANGRTVTVIINDRGPYVDGRIIDLSDDAFARLAPLDVGTINVRIVW